MSDLVESKWARYSLLFCVLLLLTVLTRFDDLVTDTNAWDEATFILMAKDVLRGHLPYIASFDNKPPVLFFALAAVQWLFGESLLVIRLFGDALIAATALLCFLFARRRTGEVPALLGATLVVAMHALAFARVTQSETLAIFLVTAAMLVAASARRSALAAAFAGTLMALAVLTRSNLALPTLAMGLFYAFLWYRDKSWVSFRSAALFAVGGLAVLGTLCAVYLFAGQWTPFQLALFDVPASYATEQRSPGRLILSHGLKFVRSATQFPFTMLPFAIVLAAGLAVMARTAAAFTGAEREKRDEALLVLLVTGATAVSIVVGGEAYKHYWLQLVPFAGIALAWALENLEGRPAWQFGGAATAALPILSALASHAVPSVRTMVRLDAIEARYPLKRAAALIQCRKRPGERVWAVQGHLVHWYLGDRPISPAATHPTNLVRESIIAPLERAGYVPPDSFRRVLDSRPAFVVQASRNIPYSMEDRGEEYAAWRDRSYRLWKADPDFKIYVRRDRRIGSEPC